MTSTQTTPWAAKASALYDPAYARRYRAHDDEFDASEPCRRFAEWLQQVCASVPPPIDVLDLGCGTGRYFWALTGVGELVGIDASAAMLAEARVPFNAGRITAERVTLVEGDLFSHEFGDGRFDLVYSIGVLAEHVPFDAAVVGRVSRWLKPGGRFAFTTVHPQSPSIPNTMKRRIGRSIAALAPAAVAQPIRARLLAGGLYADEARITELLTPRFAIDALWQFESEAHRHCWCVARRQPA
jgi:SAM-dependent methyltransferase